MSARSVVITGAAGSIGQLAVERLARRGFRVHAVDKRALERLPLGSEAHQVDISKRGFDDVLRRVRPDAVLHLARERRFTVAARERYRLNFEGTARVFELCLGAGVKKFVFPSRHTVYGALADNPAFLREEHPPTAGRTFPEIQDLVAADLYVSALLWRNPEIEVVVLRPVNVLGPTVNTLFSRYLSPRRVFTVAGYDPVHQVLHEDDLAGAFERALAPGLRGVFNVTGPGEVPLHVIVEESGAERIPLPEPVIRIVRGRLGFAGIPQGALDFLKYPCTVDGNRFREATGFVAEHGLRETIRSLRGRRT
ncbi:MAG: NAD-dependent epimerase/dehydratase family protein [Polyangiaceae bacterium]